MFKKILIANRGEIACRVIRTAKRMGVRCVAVYSDADRNAQHVKMADEAVALGGLTAKESYLLADKIIKAAKDTGAEAIHPGYGFLSENAEFADACAKAGVVFIGPPAGAIRAMGSKSAAKALMEKAKVPVVPGYHGEEQSIDLLRKTAAKIGYPVLLKAVAGGGGKGMRRVDNESELESALAGAQREAQSSFGDARVLIEKYILQPRHIEIQVFADNHGNTVYLFERDCSIQRRHQKVVEEAPAPNISDKQRKSMGKAAVDAAKAVGYSGAGTVEFIADQSGNFYFMEMNTRLQVEHPVTEKITGLDLVEWQLRVASGEKLGFAQDDLSINGHAIEIRLYAEDPARDFLPQIGTLHHLQFPSENRHVRIDTGVVTGDTITPFYDPMIAKVIVWGHDRMEAVREMRAALAATEVAGLHTNLGFLRRIVGHKAFADAKLSTDFIAAHRNDLHDTPGADLQDLAYVLAALYQARPNDGAPSGWRLSGGGESFFYFKRDGKALPVRISWNGANCKADVNGKLLSLGPVQWRGHQASFDFNGKTHKARVVPTPGQYYVLIDGESFDCAEWRFVDMADQQADHGGLLSPMPGKVVQVLVSANQNVEKGQALLILEAMKMEHTIKAPQSGKIAEIFYKVGEQVAEGVELLSLEPLGKAS